MRAPKALKLGGALADLDSPSWLTVGFTGDRLGLAVVGFDRGCGLLEIGVGDLSAEESAILDRALTRALRRSVKVAAAPEVL